MTGDTAPISEIRRLQLTRFLPFVINQLATQVSTDLSRIYGYEYDLSIQEWRILANLGEHATLSASQIIKITGMEKSMISRAVKALKDKGYILEQKSPHDSRAKELRLTSGGSVLLSELAPKVLEWEDKFVECLSDAEYLELWRLIDKLGAQVTGLR